MPLAPRIGLQWHFCHLFNLHARETEFRYDLSFDQVNAVTAEGVLTDCLREVNGVEKMAVRVDKGAKVHPLLLHGPDVLDGYKQAQHPQAFS